MDATGQLFAAAIFAMGGLAGSRGGVWLNAYCKDASYFKIWVMTVQTRMPTVLKGVLLWSQYVAVSTLTGRVELTQNVSLFRRSVFFHVAPHMHKYLHMVRRALRVSI
jgi:hypothetical protein